MGASDGSDSSDLISPPGGGDKSPLFQGLVREEAVSSPSSTGTYLVPKAGEAAQRTRLGGRQSSVGAALGGGGTQVAGLGALLSASLPLCPRADHSHLWACFFLF